MNIYFNHMDTHNMLATCLTHIFRYECDLLSATYRRISTFYMDIFESLKMQ